MEKLSDAQVHKIYAPFGLKPCAETAQAILDEPRMPERFRKLAFNYTEIGQKCRAENSRSTAAMSLRGMLNNREFLSAAEVEQLEDALALLEQIAKHPEYQEARAYQVGQHVNQSLANYSKGKC